MSQPKVCVAVLNWNNYEHTIRCLQSLEQLDYSNFAVIVIDNASTNESAARIRQAAPSVELIRSGSNLGYAGGNELALRRALADEDTELFWILNNDARVAPDTLSHLVAAYQQHGPALYGGVPLVDDEGEWRIRRLTLWHFFLGRRSLMYTTTLNNRPYRACFPTLEPRPVNNLHGSHLMIPLSVIREYGFMDTRFFLYAEEDEYCLRLAQRGIKSILVPASAVFHRGSGASEGHNQLFYVAQYYGLRNRLVVVRRHLGFGYFVFQILLFLYKIVRDRLFGKSDLARSPLNLQYRLLGMRDGILGRLGKTLAPENFLDKPAAEQPRQPGGATIKSDRGDKK